MVSQSVYLFLRENSHAFVFFMGFNSTRPFLRHAHQQIAALVFTKHSNQTRVCSSMAADGCVRISVGQMCVTNNVEENIDHCDRLAAEASSCGSSMLFLPECAVFMGKKYTESVAMAEPLDGPLMGRLRDVSKKNNLWLSVGGFQEACDEQGKIYNTHVIIDNEGALVARYRKMHLFDVDLPDKGVTLTESLFTKAGEELAVCPSPAGCLGLSVCYDLRFPYLYQKLRYDMGAEVLLIPAAFTVPTGRAHWEVLLRARAIETQTYVIAAAQWGRHHEKRESWGHSMVIDPMGHVVACLEQGTGLITADIDLGLVRETRERMPMDAHRRVMV